MSKNIVFIVNITDSAKQSRTNPYQYSIKSWSKWCQKNNWGKNRQDPQEHLA